MTTKDFEWLAILPGGKVLHAMRPHPLASQYYWTPCGRFAGKKVVAEPATKGSVPTCKQCLRALQKYRLQAVEPRYVHPAPAIAEAGGRRRWRRGRQ